MKLNKIKAKVSRYLLNSTGLRINRKVVVFESDDWGSIRMPSKEVYEKALKAGYPVNKIAYEKYDSLLSQNDLEMLFNLLTSFRDVYGNHPVFTANCVVANPNFDLIRQNYFKEYHYESIIDTFRRYPEHENNFLIWNKGLLNNIFFPQYHAREHLNVRLFMDDLRNGNRDALFGFNNQMPGSIALCDTSRGNPYVEPLRYNSYPDKENKLAIFLEGLDLFDRLFGYKSESIIPPNYIWSPDFNESVFNKGVNILQGIRKMVEPIPEGKNKYYTFSLGERTTYGQIRLIRNALFEPSLWRLGIKDPVGNCLSEMDIAFRMNKPAIISSHRINYVGFIDKTNRDRTLKMLSQLLDSALKRWPDIEFKTSVQLGAMLKNKCSNY